MLLFGFGLLNSQSLETEMDHTMQGYVDLGRLHGCVAYVQKGGEVLLHKAYGYSDIKLKKELKEDAIFNIASMAKTVTAVGALILYEEGKFLLDDPIEKYLPELNNLQVLQNAGTDSAALVPLSRSITIRDLFRHTAGFGYAYLEEEINHPTDSLYVAKELHYSKSSEEFLTRIAAIPLKYQPGSQWEYSYSLDVLGFLVERVTHRTLHDFLTERVFGPLAMNSTGFYLDEEDLGRLSNLYIESDGALEAVPGFQNQYKSMPGVRAGGGGLGRSIDGALLSTASDFARFCTMLLAYGELEGKRILQPQTVELLISNQIAGITKQSFPVGEYGFGVGVNTYPYQGKTNAISWTGAFNTIFVVNYKMDLVAVFLTQHEPWGHLGIMDEFLMVIERTVR